MNIHVRFARIVTPVYTYVKYSFVADDNARTVTVVNPRTHEQFVQLTDTTVTLLPGDSRLAGQAYRIEGVDPDGAPAVWLVDDLNCGCRSSTRVVDTEPEDVPS